MWSHIVYAAFAALRYLRINVGSNETVFVTLENNTKYSFT
jgi:hypothetical protein